MTSLNANSHLKFNNCTVIIFVTISHFPVPMDVIFIGPVTMVIDEGEEVYYRHKFIEDIVTRYLLNWCGNF